MKFLITGSAKETNLKLASCLSSITNLDLRELNDTTLEDNLIYYSAAIQNVSSYSDNERILMTACLSNNLNCIMVPITEEHVYASLYLLIKLKPLNMPVIPVIVKDKISDVVLQNKVRDYIENFVYLSPIIVDEKTINEEFLNLVEKYSKFKRIPTNYPKIYAKDVSIVLYKIEEILISTQFDITNPKFITQKVLEKDEYFSSYKTDKINTLISQLEIENNLKADEIMCDQIYDSILINL